MKNKNKIATGVVAALTVSLSTGFPCTNESGSWNLSLTSQSGASYPNCPSNESACGSSGSYNESYYTCEDSSSGTDIIFCYAATSVVGATWDCVWNSSLQQCQVSNVVDKYADVTYEFARCS